VAKRAVFWALAWLMPLNRNIIGAILSNTNAAHWPKTDDEWDLRVNFTVIMLPKWGFVKPRNALFTSM